MRQYQRNARRSHALAFNSNQRTQGLLVSRHQTFNVLRLERSVLYQLVNTYRDQSILRQAKPGADEMEHAGNTSPRH